MLTSWRVARGNLEICITLEDIEHILLKNEKDK